MEPRWTILLDFDGTLSDPRALMRQYVEALAGQFQKDYGGKAEEWREITSAMLTTLTEEFQDHFVHSPSAPYNLFMESLYHRSTEIVHQSKGLGLPSDPVGFARRTQIEALSRCNATYAGVSEGLRWLLERRHTLHMASGQESGFLQGAMQGANLGHLPRRWYGPDLIDCAKESAEYYRRIFQDLAVSPEQIVVLDDLPAALVWAQELGAKTVQMRLDSRTPYAMVPGVSAVMTDWSQLPEIFESLAY